jgi:FkbM family methyltransferase
MKFYSQYGQDRFIAEQVFKQKRNGFFLDIGAYDGITMSNTFVFEKEFGWKGVCIEPNPIVFDQLKINRSCTTVNCCISDRECQVKFMAVSGWGVMLSGILDFFDKRHIERIDKAIEEHGGRKELIDIPSLPLHKILDKHNINKIDYCSIDVEGGELKVLDSLDFSKVDVRVLTIENNYGTNEVRNYLKPYGYSLIAKIGSDEIYEKNSSNFLMIFKFRMKELKKNIHQLKNNLLKLSN